MFPDLLPEKEQNKLNYPEEIDKLHGTELENGIIALTEFLTKVCVFKNYQKKYKLKNFKANLLQLL